MNKSADILALAKWHLAEQEKNIHRQREIVDGLAHTGLLDRSMRAGDKLMQMQKVAIRLRMEVDALESYEVARKRLQETRAHA